MASRLKRTWADKSSKVLRSEGTGHQLSQNLHASGWFAAVRAGNLGEIQKFIDDKIVDVNFTDPEGHTAFFIACLEGQVRAARLLYKHGADPEFADKTGTNAFWAACHSGNLAVVQFLHEQIHVADTEKPISNGATSHRPYSHLDAPYFISLVSIHTKYNRARLNDSTVYG